MATALACIDGSAYAASVCDHAAWLAGSPNGVIDLLHVNEASTKSQKAVGKELLRTASERLEHQGAVAGRALDMNGVFADVALAEAASADVIVMGKRGEAGPSRRKLGSNATALIRKATGPMCLVSQLYLPVYRGLVLIDADPAHRRTVEFVASHPILSTFDLDIILMQPIGMDPEPKLSWARQALGSAKADVFPMLYGTPDEAAARYMDDHQVDILIMSRQMLFDQERGLGMAIASRALWTWRTPLFIC